MKVKYVTFFELPWLHLDEQIETLHWISTILLL